ncbi:hypothetical protein [Phytoactinopolyspora limicola]|uniref:hypothetical protein n=1 Tax=Phytoactinopolyspora limicola TaxID=2715536 RepID=UPI00140756D9|nr:hypothetical protein [Phytoactinopolyspora limicola]
MIDVETWRALTRSSPWLWSSVRLTRTMVGGDDDAQVRAWIRRPGLMRVEQPGHEPYFVDETSEVGRGRGYITVVEESGPRRAVNRLLGRNPKQPPQPVFRTPRDPLAPQPDWRPDGLVARRPDDFTVVFDDPMYENYVWVAMLDPVELADGMEPDGPVETGAEQPAGVDILDLAETQRRGRPTLVATVRSARTYNPRCTCCALLFSDVTIALLREEGGPLPEPLPAPADAHRVMVDRTTGICVSLRDIGGDHDGAGFDVDIEEVDVDYPDLMFRRR